MIWGDLFPHTNFYSEKLVWWTELIVKNMTGIVKTHVTEQRTYCKKYECIVPVRHQNWQTGSCSCQECHQQQGAQHLCTLSQMLASLEAVTWLVEFAFQHSQSKAVAKAAQLWARVWWIVCHGGKLIVGGMLQYFPCYGKRSEKWTHNK